MTTRIPSAQSSPERMPAPDSTYTLPLAWRIGLSALLLFHLLAVFLPPFQFAARSPLADLLIFPFRPYSGALYLHQGYAFFAPNPGPSHLIQYKVEFADGRAPIEGRFPDLKAQQPRLKYHRHFMIAEAYNNSYEPPTPRAEPSPPALNAQLTDRERLIRAENQKDYIRSFNMWQHRRKQYEAMTKSIENHLLKEYGGSKVTLTRIEHQLLLPFQVRELQMRPNDPSTFIPLPEIPPSPTRGDN